MPGEIIGEFILRPIVEIIVQVFCYFTGRVIVPMLTLGLVYVEPAPKGTRVVKPRWHGFHRATRGRYVVDADMGALLGLLFWALVIVVVVLVYRSAT